MKPTDNIVGAWHFNPPYRFMVVKCIKWDKKQNEIVYVVDDAALAYVTLMQLRDNDKLTPKEYLYDWCLWDSFNRDAEDFCKKASEQPIELTQVPETVEV